MFKWIHNLHHVYAGILVPLTAWAPIYMGIKARTYRQQHTRLLLAYLLFAFIINFSARILGMLHHNNLPLLHVYTLIEGLLLLAYHRAIFHIHRLKKAISFCMVAFTVLCVADVSVFHSLYTFNAYARSVASILIIALTLLFLFVKDQHVAEEHGRHEALNWFNAGLLLYYGSSLVYFALLNLISSFSSDSTWYLIENIHASFVFIMYLLFTIGFFRAKS